MRTSLALLVVVLLAVPIWWILSRGVELPESAPERTGPESRPSTSRVLEGAEAPRSSQSATVSLPDPFAPDAAAETELPRGGSLVGSLVWEKSWTPARDLEVRTTTRWLDASGAGPEDRPFLRNVVDSRAIPAPTTTDAEGRFRLDGVPLDRTTFLVVAVNGAMLELVKLERLPPIGVTIDLGEIRLSPRGSVRGRIEHGGQARVRVVDDPIFQNALLDPAEHARMLAIASDFAPELFANGKREAPRPLGFPEVRTDEDGTFTLRGIRPGVVWLVVEPKHDTPLRRRILVEPEKVTELGTFRAWEEEPSRRVGLEETGAVRLVATSGTSRGIRDFEFDSETGESHSLSSAGLTHGFEPTKVRAARVRRGSEPIWEPVSFRLEPIPERERRFYQGRHTTRLAVEVPDAAEVLVHVVAPDGTPIRGARVELHRTDRGPLGPASKLRTLTERRTGANFAHFTGDLPRVPYWLLVTPPAGRPMVREIDAVSQQSIQVTVQDGGHRDLTIQCRDREGNPVAGAEIWAAWLRRGMEPRFVGRSDAAGALRVRDVPREGVAFAAQHPAFATSPASATPRDDVIAIVLERGAHVTGVVTERGERSSATWMVIARPSETLARLHAMNPFLEPRIVPTTEAGTFELRGLLPGTWTFAVAHPRAARKTLDLAQLGRQDVVLELEPEGIHTLSGVVTVDGVHGTGLVARLYAGGQHFAQRVARDGSFAFPGAPDGPCSLSFERLQPKAAPALLWRGELPTPPHGETFAITTGSLALTLLGADAQPLRGVEVTLELVTEHGLRTDGAWTTVSDGVGIARFESVPQGTWRVRAPGFDPGPRGSDVLVQGGQATTVTLPRS